MKWRCENALRDGLNLGLTRNVASPYLQRRKNERTDLGGCWCRGKKGPRENGAGASLNHGLAEYHKTIRIWPVVGSPYGFELTRILQEITENGCLNGKEQEQGQTGGRVMSPSLLHHQEWQKGTKNLERIPPLASPRLRLIVLQGSLQLSWSFWRVSAVEVTPMIGLRGSHGGRENRL